MQIGGRKLDLDALLVVMLGVKMLEEGDRVLGRQLEAVEVLRKHGAHVGGKALEELHRSLRKRGGSGPCSAKQ